MRKLMMAALTATAVWTGYWWVGATALEKGVTDWLTAQPEGMIRVASSEVHGIPNRFDLTLTELVVNRRDLGFIWKAPFVQVYSMSWKPWHVIAALPNSQVIYLDKQKVSISSTKMIGNAIVHPNSLVALSEIVAEVHDLALISDAGWQASLAGLAASIREDLTQANTYRLGLRLSALIPDPRLNVVLAQADLPPRIDEVFLDAHATFSAPFNRLAAETPPQLHQLVLNEARLTWGDVLLTADGMIAPDATGLAQGEISIAFKGWKKLPPLLVALRMVQPEMQQAMTGMMQAMAAQGDDPEVLTLVFSAKDGQMTLGPFPLGPAPNMR